MCVQNVKINNYFSKIARIILTNARSERRIYFEMNDLSTTIKDVTEIPNNEVLDRSPCFWGFFFLGIS